MKMRLIAARRTAASVICGAIVCAAIVAGAVPLQSQNAASPDKPEKIIVDGSTTVGPIAQAFAEYYSSVHPNVKITVSQSGSGNGVKSLINGSCQIASMSRFMKDTEFKAAVDNKVLPVAHTIALDGLAIIVHPSNPIKALKIEQVRDIYLGKIKSWKETGGPDVPIVSVSRDTNSGTYETFEEKVMAKGKIAENVEYLGSNGAIRQKVQTTQGAIGYVGLGFADKTVSALTINGVAPSPESVISGQYPIARPLYFFTNGYPEMGSNLYSFCTLHLTKKGQEIIEGVGFVPLTTY
ncbi:MAG: phosphate ABC transporter substrate-binding protein [Candidatus Sumerlaeota bacterium]|nr:phosphate ABC transporter substrate-binding protein [Candidatus Sumerlaeota bacterium]